MLIGPSRICCTSRISAYAEDNLKATVRLSEDGLKTNEQLVWRQFEANFDIALTPERVVEKVVGRWVPA
jgi:hypothetical protein